MAWRMDHLNVERSHADGLRHRCFFEAGTQNNHAASSLVDKFFKLALLGAHGGICLLDHFFDAINVRYAAEILVRGVDEKGAIHGRPEVLEQARDLGRRLAQGEVLGPIKMGPLAV